MVLLIYHDNKEKALTIKPDLLDIDQRTLLRQRQGLIVHQAVSQEIPKVHSHEA
jgi:hypothetical protein